MEKDSAKFAQSIEVVNVKMIVKRQAAAIDSNRDYLKTMERFGLGAGRLARSGHVICIEFYYL